MPAKKSKPEAEQPEAEQPEGPFLTYIGTAAEVTNQGQVFERNKAVSIAGREDAFAKLAVNPKFELSD